MNRNNDLDFKIIVLGKLILVLRKIPSRKLT